MLGTPRSFIESGQLSKPCALSACTQACSGTTVLVNPRLMMCTLTLPTPGDTPSIINIDQVAHCSWLLLACSGRGRRSKVRGFARCLSFGARGYKGFGEVQKAPPNRSTSGWTQILSRMNHADGADELLQSMLRTSCALRRRGWESGTKGLVVPLSLLRSCFCSFSCLPLPHPTNTRRYKFVDLRKGDFSLPIRVGCKTSRHCIAYSDSM